MAILHGSWISQLHAQSLNSLSSGSLSVANEAGTAELTDGCFFLWGEIWRRLEPQTATTAETEAVQPHPFAMTHAELLTFLRSLHQAHKLQWTVADFPLEEPTQATPRRGKRSAVATEPTLSLRWRSFWFALPTYQSAIAESEAAADSQPNAASAELDAHPATDSVPQLSGLGTIQRVPQHSAAVLQPDAEAAASALDLYPWQVGGICLTPLEATQLLNSLPLVAVSEADSFVGSDLRFWSHVARWSLDLLARAKFLPALRLVNGALLSTWNVLLDSDVDQTRLRQFARQMPAACRTYHDARAIASPSSSSPAANSSDSSPTNSSPTNSSPLEANPVDQLLADFTTPVLARPLLLDFLNRVVDAQIRTTLRAAHTDAAILPAVALPKDVALREWLQSFAGAEAILCETAKPIAADPQKAERLQAVLTQWLTPLQHHLNQQDTPFRTCFYLHPPLMGHLDWTLEYFLQAVDDPECLVSARTIWHNPVDRLVYSGRTIDQPQETLLAGLGLASRLHPGIEPSLQTQQPQSCRMTPLQVYEFIKTTAWRLQDSGFGVVLPPSLANQQGWANRLGLSVQAETPTKRLQGLGLKSLLNFKWELTIGGQRLSKAEFDRLVALDTPLVEINGEWVELRSQDVRAAQEFFASRKEQMSLSLEDALRMSTGDTQIVEKLPVVSFEASGALEELINTLTTGNQDLTLIPTPRNFRGELRPYQIRGASWMAFLEQWGLGACLADDMGLGKTVQLIALLLHLQENDLIEHPTLLVCPTSVLGNWEREVKRFAPTLKVLLHHGDKRSQGKTFAKTMQAYHLVLTSYALVYRDEKELQSVKWQGVVLDEAQNIKNSEAKQSQAVRQLDAQFRIALTGTPVENRLSELWSILDFLNPGYLGPRNFFQRRFGIPIERYGDTDSLKTLRSLVQPFILRRLKTDRSIIQDLPDKQEMTVFCGLTSDQAAIYQQLVDHSLEQIEAAEGIQRHGMILALLTRLKQVCNHPALLKDDGGRMKDEGGSAAAFLARSGKLQRLTEMLEEILAEGDRTLIFTQFAEWGKDLQAYLEQQFKGEVLFLYGSTSRKQREVMVDRFQNDPQAPRIFILSLKAGGVGLNLTRANHVFHFDRWWNPAVENQATDRVFRIGQTRNVQVHKFVCTGTLEERIHELIESKKALSEQVVGTGETWLTELDTDQLRNMLMLDRSAIIDD